MHVGCKTRCWACRSFFVVIDSSCIKMHSYHHSLRVSCFQKLLCIQAIELVFLCSKSDRHVNPGCKADGTAAVAHGLRAQYHQRLWASHYILLLCACRLVALQYVQWACTCPLMIWLCAWISDATPRQVKGLLDLLNSTKQCHDGGLMSSVCIPPYVCAQQSKGIVESLFNSRSLTASKNS